MSVSPYTLNNLYNQGILDYAPYDLCNSGINVSSLNGISNPYLNTAMQGTQFQNYGNTPDCFCASGNYGMENNPYLSNGTGVISTATIGSKSTAGQNAYGLQGIGDMSNAGLNAYGIDGIGAKAPSQINAWGGFGDVERDFSDGFSNASSFWQRIPTPIKGIAAAGMMLGAVAISLKTKKKPPEAKTSFFSKLNPVNWFKKTKTTNI